MSELGIAFVGLELQSHVLEPSLHEPPSTAAQVCGVGSLCVCVYVYSVPTCSLCVCVVQEALLTTPTGIEMRPPGDPVISTPLMSSFPAQ